MFGLDRKPGIDKRVQKFIGDSGSASRFFKQVAIDEEDAKSIFYCAKASRKDRNEGLGDPGQQFKHGATLRDVENARTAMNNHPTVKPTALCRYLCRLVTPPGGTVFDPFMGSGSTGKAAILEGFDFIGIEREREYVEIARARIADAIKKRAVQLELFDDVDKSKERG
jgi:site-specific DNA-methyltransferase (adenine-specific)